MYLRVLGLGLLQDGDVGVGVFPESEEIPIGRASFWCAALQGIGFGRPGASVVLFVLQYGTVEHKAAQALK